MINWSQLKSSNRKPVTNTLSYLQESAIAAFRHLKKAPKTYPTNFIPNLLFHNHRGEIWTIQVTKRRFKDINVDSFSVGYVPWACFDSAFFKESSSNTLERVTKISLMIYYWVSFVGRENWACVRLSDNINSIFKKRFFHPMPIKHKTAVATHNDNY